MLSILVMDIAYAITRIDDVGQPYSMTSDWKGNVFVRFDNEIWMLKPHH
jgi:hypothetical protein